MDHPDPSTIIAWLERTDKNHAWLATVLGMDTEDVILALEVGFDQEDLDAMAKLMAT